MIIKSKFRIITFSLICILSISLLSGFSFSESQGQVYEQATELSQSENITSLRESLQLFEMLGNYSDSAVKAEEIRTIINSRIKSSWDNLQKGDYIEFGSYVQKRDSDDAEPILWRVLDVGRDRTLVISEYGLDAGSFDNTDDEVGAWDRCSVRSWLNEEFLSDAFTEEELQKIIFSDIQNNTTEEYQTEMILDGGAVASFVDDYSGDAGEDTQDYLFLLSIDEVYKFFNDANDRLAIPTDYAIGRGAYQDELSSGTSPTAWWLRSPGYYDYNVGFVGADGVVYSDGADVSLHTSFMIRPAMYIETPLREINDSYDSDYDDGYSDYEDSEYDDSDYDEDDPDYNDDNETTSEQEMNLSQYLGGSFDFISQDIPSLVQTENSPDKVKWENSSMSVTGTDQNNIVRIRYSGGLDGYSVYGIYPGMGIDATDLTLESQGLNFEKSTDDGWFVYLTTDDKMVAFDLDENNCIVDIYVAFQGYSPVSF